MMNVFVLSNRTERKDKKLLGLTPDSRILFQAKAAGATKAVLLRRAALKTPLAPDGLKLVLEDRFDLDADPEKVAKMLAGSVDGPVCVFDSEAIFQRDFAAYAFAHGSNTTFKAGSRTVAAVRFDAAISVDEDIAGRAVDTTTPGGIKAAKKMLLNGLRKPVLVDGIVGYYIMRPITLRVTSVIVNTPIRPNHVTAFCMILGFLGAAMVAVAGNRAWMMQVGMLLYFAGATLDCVDGEMARLKYAGSYIGAWFDTISDDFTTAAMLVAMGFYQGQMTGNTLWVIIGATAALVFLVGEVWVYYWLATVYHSGDVLDFQWATGRKKKPSAETFTDYLSLMAKRDFFSFALLVMSLFGLVSWGLVWLSFMMYVFIVYVVVDIVLSLKNRGWRTGSSN